MRIAKKTILLFLYLSGGFISANPVESSFDRIRKRNLEEVKQAIRARVDLNVKNGNGNTLLIEAVIDDNDEIVKELINAKVNLNLKNNDGETALMIALYRNNQKIVKLLKAAGASRIFWPWAEPFENNNPDLAIAQADIRAGAELNVRYRNGLTPLIWSLCCLSDNDMAELLIKAKADLNMADIHGNTPLSISILYNRIEITKLLVKLKVNVNVKSADGSTPLMVAINTFDPQIIQLLVEAGADVNAQDNTGKSVLSQAIKTKKKYEKIANSAMVKIIKILEAAGAKE